MGRVSVLALVGLLLTSISTEASASELRLGLSNHDVRGLEGGVTVQGQFVLGEMPEKPGKVKFRPFVTFSANSSGNLLRGGGGVQLNVPVSKKWFLELQTGIVAHDGQLQPVSPEFPEGRRLREDRRLFYGCPALFHLSPAVGRRIGKRAHLSVYYIHASHGGILCSTDINDGIDNVGARIGFEF